MCRICAQIVDKEHFETEEHIEKFNSVCKIKIDKSLKDSFITIKYKFIDNRYNYIYTDLYFKKYIRDIILKDIDTNKYYKSYILVYISYILILTLNLNSSTVSNYSFNFSEFATLINVQFRELSFKIERIINRISSIEESVTDHGAIINDLERGISLIANRLDKISYHNDKVHKFTQTNHNSCSSLPLTKTPCNLNTQFRTTPTVTHAPRSAVSHSSVTPKSVPRSHPPRAVTHQQSSHTSRSTIPAPTSTLPRHIAPLVPSSPRQYPSPQSTLTKDAPLFSDIVKATPPHLNPALPGVAVTSGNVVGKTVLIMDDSNTRHVHLDGEGVSETRIPTYVVEDIDPHKCKGFDIVWLHVGVNSLKPRNYGDLRGVREKFGIFMSKVHKIAEISPKTI